MTLDERRSELIQQISHITDENILIVLQEELSCHEQPLGTIDLSDSDLKELIEQANEPDDKDIVSEAEYLNATSRWRVK